jgi:hypothetical protein
MDRDELLPRSPFIETWNSPLMRTAALPTAMRIHD